MKYAVRLLIALVWISSAGGAAIAQETGDKAKRDAASAPIAAADAAKAMTLPDGFQVTLFAGEPDVRQPIAFTIDPKGRLWVAECYSYPKWSQTGTGDDRILIFDDTDGDGHFDSRKVFCDKLPNVSGLTLGFGGVWVCSTPNLLFIPDRNGDDVPDSAPEIKLDGWSLKAEHNVFNALNWGPDGWLYGCNGILSISQVGKPGTPDGERTPMNCGVWRYHPTREVFEVVAHGTTNPWGLDFDDYGELFITNCVIPHVYRAVPGAHLQRMFGQDYNPYLFGLIGSVADHVHWNTVEAWSDIRALGVTPTTDRAGGGHAHAGGMVYLGDNWPDQYRNSLFLNNIHGNRVNHDTLEREGARYVARHQKDFLLANDTWFRGLELKYGPDGAVYVTDWSDTGECHESDADGAHRENGRIYKVSYGKPRPVRVDLAAAEDATLVAYQTHKNDWFVRTARRLLQERAAAGKDVTESKKALWRQFDEQPETTRKLRAMWTLNAIGGLGDAELRKLLAHDDESVRSWAVRLLANEGLASAASLEALAAMGATERSAAVRLSLASALQRIPAGLRWGLARDLLAHEVDATDPYIPLMLWYGVEPLVATDPSRAGDLAVGGQFPVARQYVARRMIAADQKAGLSALVSVLDRTNDANRVDLLDGMIEALRGQRHVEVPEGWPKVAAALDKSDVPAVREKTTLLSLRFGDSDALKSLVALAENPDAAAGERERALQALIEQRVSGLSKTMQALLDDPKMCAPALRGLAAYDDEGTPDAILSRYSKLNDAQRADAVGTMISRVSFASALIDAVDRGVVPKRDLSASVARQIQAFGDKPLAERFEKAWGVVRPTSTEKARLIAAYKAMLVPEKVRGADSGRGRQIFDRACARCHKLYDAGGDVGPELTGSDRRNLDYILENVLDPSAMVGRDYQLNVVMTTDGRLLSGIIREQDDKRVVIQTETDRVVLDRGDIEETKSSPASMMPEGLIEALSPEELADLIAYLSTESQVQVPAKDGQSGSQ